MRKCLVVVANHLMYKLPLGPIEIWLILGIFFIAIELLHLPNIGFLFLGLGALSCGILISISPGFFITYQWIVFGLASLFWFAALWSSLKRYGDNKNVRLAYSDMINNEVYVLNRPMIAGGMGEVKWSGTIMNARLDDIELEEAAIGEKLYIKEVRGNILICSKKMIGK